MGKAEKAQGKILLGNGGGEIIFITEYRKEEGREEEEEEKEEEEPYCGLVGGWVGGWTVKRWCLPRPGIEPGTFRSSV